MIPSFKALMYSVVICLFSAIVVDAQQGSWPTGVEGCGDVSLLARKTNGAVVTFSPKQMKAMSVSRVSPKFPNTCRCQGTVVVAVVVNIEGNVDCVRKISGHPLLDQSATEAAKQWKFKPMKRNGKPVAFVGLLTFTFMSYGAISF